MLKITKNQIKIGQKLIVVKEQKEYDICSSSDDISSKGIQLSIGTKLTITEKNSSWITISDGKREYQSGWSSLKTFTDIDGENLGEGKKEYVIFFKGKKHKPKKFSDMGKIKSSLMNEMSYHEKLEVLAQNYEERCPEHKYSSVPEWIGYGNNMSREDFKHFEIFEWENRKVGKKVDFDPVAYYDELITLMIVTAQFGSAVRDLYKKTKDTHKLIVCFMHEEYRKQPNPKSYYWPSFEDLGESETIKVAMKTAGVKSTKKTTKYGKTAIAFETEGGAVSLLKLIKPEEYFILDMQGQELTEKSQKFVVMISRMKKLERVLKYDLKLEIEEKYENQECQEVQ